MIKKIKAEIHYDVLNNHPDLKYIKYPDIRQRYIDIYAIDDNCFYGEDDMYDYIKEDLMLVAGGGYNTDTIANVKFYFEEVA